MAISKTDMLMTASHLESRADDAYMEHDDVHMTPQEVHALALDIKTFALEHGRETCHVSKLRGCIEDDVFYSCSVCGYGQHASKYGRPFRYCPNCGAEVVEDAQ